MMSMVREHAVSGFFFSCAIYTYVFLSYALSELSIAQPMKVSSDLGLCGNQELFALQLNPTGDKQDPSVGAPAVLW